MATANFPSQATYRIAITGLVQGVGFRPYIWRLAHAQGLAGQVLNDGEGVKVFINADEPRMREFIAAIKADLPPLARIDSVAVKQIAPRSFDDFLIVESEQNQVVIGCAPDAATCEQCLSELFDPTNRRYRYPFINCTNCGPRLSIIQKIPYDRASTTMSVFGQCEACLTEYNAPAHRRFHAQPNACAHCGPSVWLEDTQGQTISSVDAFYDLAVRLKQGQIIALKGLGGFHLVCDATHDQAVARLRQRKFRPHKPFALMVKDEQALDRYATVTEQELKALKSPAAPVVLLTPQDTPTQAPLSELIAPDQAQLGFMLPYTPIHHLLLETLDTPLVMTSGNRSGSPQAIDNDDARAQLSDIADVFLMHNRDIENRVDDSVVRFIDGQQQVLRRARGYAPSAMMLPEGFEQAPELIALGADLKNTLCFLKQGRAVVSQHLGDLEELQTYEQYQSTLALYQNLYQLKGQRWVSDRHPEYLSTKLGVSLEEQGGALTQVQHHHAHLAACLGDNQYPKTGRPVLGICLDGTGYGLDDTLWGGELLLGNYQGFERLAHFSAFPLVSGVKAIKEPWRCLYGLLSQCGELASNRERWQNQLPMLASPMCRTFDQMIEKGINSPMSSSAGRLFDAVAAALGCYPAGISYEGQAAIALESLALKAKDDLTPYPFALTETEINPKPCLQAMLQDLEAGVPPEQIAKRFHVGVAQALVDTVALLKEQYAFEQVALTGGVLQNQLLHRLLVKGLEQQGVGVLIHKNLPPNDGGIALGQALVAAARLT
ncbi:MAG: carbamoyltransferase HypF [Pontibacterium sp.]